VDKLYGALIAACFTLVGGVLLLVVTQIITRFVVDPLVDFRRLLGEVAYTLILRANVLFNPSTEAYNPATNTSSPRFREAKDECRKLASRLHAFSAAVPLYGTLAKIGLIPPLANVYEAAGV
jgi:hypothetical protein